MPSLTRLGDNSAAHSCYPSTNSILGASNKVYCNGIKAGIVGLKFSAHSCDDDTHDVDSRVVTVGSNKVFIEGISSVRIGDPIACGDTVGSGSENVFCG